MGYQGGPTARAGEGERVALTYLCRVLHATPIPAGTSPTPSARLPPRRAGWMVEGLCRPCARFHEGGGGGCLTALGMLISLADSARRSRTPGRSAPMAMWCRAVNKYINYYAAIVRDDRAQLHSRPSRARRESREISPCQRAGKRM